MSLYVNVALLGAIKVLTKPRKQRFCDICSRDLLLSFAEKLLTTEY